VALKETGEIAEAIRYLELYLEDPRGEDESKIKSARMELLNLQRALKKQEIRNSFQNMQNENMTQEEEA